MGNIRTSSAVLQYITSLQLEKLLRRHVSAEWSKTSNIIRTQNNKVLHEGSVLPIISDHKVAADAITFYGYLPSMAENQIRICTILENHETIVRVRHVPAYS